MIILLPGKRRNDFCKDIKAGILEKTLVKSNGICYSNQCCVEKRWSSVARKAFKNIKYMKEVHTI